MNLIKFECKKMWSTSKIRFLITLVLLIMLVFFFYCLSKEQADLKHLTRTYGEGTELYHKKSSDLSLSDWQTLLAEENSQLTTYVRIMPGIIQTKPLKKDTSPGYTYYKIRLNNELLARQIRPVSERYGTTGSNFSSIILSLLASGIGVIILLMIFGDSLVTNIENNSIQLTFSQPISRQRYLLSVYLLTWFQGIFFSFGLLLVGFTLGSLFSGIGAWDYPTVVSADFDIELIPLWQFMSRVLIIWIFVLGFVLALHFLLSIILKKSSTTLLGTLWLLTIGGVFSSQRLPLLIDVAHLNPFSYLNVVKTMSNFDWQLPRKLTLSSPVQSATITQINDSYYSNLSLERLFQNPQMGVLNAVICLGFGICLLLLIANYLFSKKASLK